MNKSWRSFILGLVLSTFVTAQAAPPTVPTTGQPASLPEIANMAEVVKPLKLERFKNKAFNRKVKVAILDNGFKGAGDEKGKSLPADVEIHEGTTAGVNITDYHGTLMAQLITGALKQSGATTNVEMHLYVTAGYSNFKKAIEEVIAGGFDLVVYAQVWEWGGNGDGKGFINALVDKALATGVIWINAAGDYGHLMHSSPVKAGRGEFAKLGTRDSVRVVCRAPEGKKCNLRLVLTWNDFKDQTDVGTEKDLDLVLTDNQGREIKSAQLKQKLQVVNDTTDSLYSREILPFADEEPIMVKAGTYHAKVKIKSANFTDRDVLKITAGGTYIEMTDYTEGETLFPPADNPSVIVIGASDDIQSSWSVKNSRPDVLLKSMVKLSDKSIPFSSSNASALGAAVGILHLGIDTEKNRDAVITQLKTITQVKNAQTPPSNNGRPPQRPKRPRPGNGNNGGQTQPPIEVDPDDGGTDTTQPGQPQPGDDDQQPWPPGSGDNGGQQPWPPGGNDGGGQQPWPPGGQQPGGQQPWPPPGGGQPSPQQPANCAQVTALPQFHNGASEAMRLGGTAVRIGNRFAIIVRFDVSSATGRRLQNHERAFATWNGIEMISVQDLRISGPPQDGYELIPQGAIPMCGGGW